MRQHHSSSVSPVRFLLLALVLSLGPLLGRDTERAQPDPIKIPRRGGPAIIPEVARDQVIGFALYTAHAGILKLSAQLYPLREGESRQVSLEVKRNTEWEVIATSAVNEDGWLATFRLEGWDASRDYPYRVRHPGGAVFEGIVRKDPVDQDEIVVAAFTGNSNSDRSLRPDIVKNVLAQDPDLLFFSGDQSYDHKHHTAAWLLFGRQFGEIVKDRPTITIPDDHDVGQGNLWGEEGKAALLGGASDGGYKEPPEYVNRVQRAQTSHLPDPYDPTPVDRGITVYYTALKVGGVDFAIIEDRKWKTGPAGIVPQQGPRPDHINNPNYDPASVDVPEARLLGDRQLAFLRAWGQDWDGVEMKAVLSQTIFAGGAHIHGKHDARLHADLDSNGWPQAGRARALREIRRAFALHIAGDQHLATVIHHGLNAWEDSNYSFCVPSIVNYYGRWWWPLEAPLQHDSKSPLPFTGRFYDGFANKLTMQAYANPTKENYNAAGYGLVRFKKSTREITLECWPRHVDVTQPQTRPFPGWPITIRQEANYNRAPIAHLPRLEIHGATSPVVQVIDDFDGVPVYTLRIRGTSWQPKVFREGTYTIKVTAGSTEHVLRGVASSKDAQVEAITVSF
jgi:hypothetical protein